MKILMEVILKTPKKRSLRRFLYDALVNTFGQAKTDTRYCPPSQTAEQKREALNAAKAKRERRAAKRICNITQQ